MAFALPEYINMALQKKFETKNPLPKTPTGIDGQDDITKGELIYRKCEFDK